MLMVCINTLPRLCPIDAISCQLPTVQNPEESIALVPKRPKVPATLRICSGWALCDASWLIDGVLILNTILGHDLPSFTHSIVARQQIMNVHGAGVDIFEIRSLQSKDAGIGAVHFRVKPDEMSGVICRFIEFLLACTSKHLVVTSGPIKQPLGIHLAVEVSEGSRKILFDEFVVSPVWPRTRSLDLRTHNPRIT